MTTTLRLPPFFVAVRADDANDVLWRGFCCCRDHAAARASTALSLSVPMLVHGPVPADHPQRREVAS